MDVQVRKSHLSKGIRPLEEVQWIESMYDANGHIVPWGWRAGKAVFRTNIFFIPCPLLDPTVGMQYLSHEVGAERQCKHLDKGVFFAFWLLNGNSIMEIWAGVGDTNYDALEYR